MKNHSLESIKKYIESKNLVSAIEKSDPTQVRQYRVFYRFLHWEFVIQGLPEGTSRQYAVETNLHCRAVVQQLKTV
jgi:hypothetical protein